MPVAIDLIDYAHYNRLNDLCIFERSSVLLSSLRKTPLVD